MEGGRSHYTAYSGKLRIILSPLKLELHFLPDKNSDQEDQNCIQPARNVHIHSLLHCLYLYVGNALHGRKICLKGKDLNGTFSSPITFCSFAASIECRCCYEGRGGASYDQRRRLLHSQLQSEAEHQCDSRDIYAQEREGGDIPLLVQFRQLLALWSFVRRGLTSRERERDA